VLAGRPDWQDTGDEFTVVASPTPRKGTQYIPTIAKVTYVPGGLSGKEKGRAGNEQVCVIASPVIDGPEVREESRPF